MSVIEVALKKRVQVSLAISNNPKRANIELLKTRLKSFMGYCRKHRLSSGYVDWLYLVSR